MREAVGEAEKVALRESEDEALSWCVEQLIQRDPEMIWRALQAPERELRTRPGESLPRLSRAMISRMLNDALRSGKDMKQRLRHLAGLWLTELEGKA